MKARTEVRASSTAAAPVLLFTTATNATAIQNASGDEVVWTVTGDPDRARALVATGGYLAIFTGRSESRVLPGAIELDPAEPAAIKTKVRAAIVAASRIDADDIGRLPYDEYIELARYASTRRYLIALLHRHSGSVTEAARGAKMKRESLHRLLRRHHLTADDFRDA